MTEPNSLLRDAREGRTGMRPLTREELADAVNAVLWRRHGSPQGIDARAIARYERGAVRWPGKEYRDALRQVLGATTDAELGFSPTTRGRSRRAQLDARAHPFGDGGVDVFAVRETSQQLVTLDNRFGGSDLGDFAAHAHYDIVRRLPIRIRAGREGQAALGELAEVVGWILFDDDKQDEALRYSHEALTLTRQAGDRTTELLTLLNLSMQYAHIGHPKTALDLAEAGRASASSRAPLVNAMFAMRAARAQSQLGLNDAAQASSVRARQLFEQGAGRADPSWTWWITESELTGHSAAVYANAGRWGIAADLYGEAIQGDGDAAPRYRSVVVAKRLLCLVRSRRWPEVEEIAPTALYDRAATGRTRALVSRIRSEMARTSGAPGHLVIPAAGPPTD